jgi:hypothetical protein
VEYSRKIIDGSVGSETYHVELWTSVRKSKDEEYLDFVAHKTLGNRIDRVKDKELSDA